MTARTAAQQRERTRSAYDTYDNRPCEECPGRRLRSSRITLPKP